MEIIIQDTYNIPIKTGALDFKTGEVCIVMAKYSSKEEERLSPLLARTDRRREET